MKTLIEEIRQKAQVPGLALSLIDEGEVALQAGFGIANCVTNQPVTPDTVFEAASLTKPLFARLVLILRDEGLIELDKPIALYLPHHRPCEDERYKLITPRHVLSHSSGFPNWRGSQALMIHTEPGTAFRYSGEGYVYLQQAIEHVTACPLEDLIQAKLLRSLGLISSSLIWSESVEASLASPFEQDGKMAEAEHMTEANAAYSLYTTVADYTRFLLEFVGLKDPLLSPSTTREMLTPHVAMSKHLHWALGWGVLAATDDSHPIYWHWGDNGNYQSFVWLSPVHKKALLLLTNSANGLIAAHEITSALGLSGSLAFKEYLCQLYESPLLV